MAPSTVTPLLPTSTQPIVQVKKNKMYCTSIVTFLLITIIFTSVAVVYRKDILMFSEQHSVNTNITSDDVYNTQSMHTSTNVPSTTTSVTSTTANVLSTTAGVTPTLNVYKDDYDDDSDNAEEEVTVVDGIASKED
jgi:hypothetical protein